ncbi:PAS domain S-box-containing protein [Bradyrhizobium erythrophlei]|nr:PAS domain S-box-containing protein [Bradyrhizobium erythrophlei]
MNPSTLFGAEGNANFQALLEDDERVFCRVGSHANADGSVLAVLPAAEHPTPATLDRLAHEYGLKEELDGAWAVRPLRLIREGGRTMLVLEDPSGEPLERLLGVPFEMDLFLRLAIDISVAVGRLHRRGLLHKDIKPANIMVNCADGQVRLTGFGIASRVPRERHAPGPPETVAGTLAYMAPEQTGRMNRSIDSRSDLYALGVTFYQMLTGCLPFTAADPMAWVHCHIARKPLPPSERSENIPAPVSEIIMKLLAKTAEERYQTAAGVESDFRHCLAERERKGRIDPFALGEHDAPDRLLLPEKLYGRAREIETLLACFDRMVNNGAVELVLVSGYSGIGKSSVVNELHRVVVEPRGLFASGKFDQYKRNIPYSTLAQAFQSLIRPLLGKSDPELAGWREAFREALGPNGRLIIDLVPELKLIVGDQPPVPELPPHDSQRRFQLVFRRFLAVFAQPEHPLALFLDDLQWLDSATLDLLEDLLTQPDVRHLILIGAYRDNEVSSAYPLIRKLEAIRKAGAVVHEIILAPLAREDLGRLIGDALHCEPERVTALAELIHEKTAGNPFFANQLISVLVEEGLLTFDYGEGRWSWDLNSIRAKGYTDNVADLMAAKLGRLPPATQKVLGQLACLGHAADSETLALVHEASDEATNAALWEAVRAGLVLRSGGTYAFLHDRVQEAAYALIVEDERAMAHLRIGRLLAARTPPEHLEENIFDIVNQFDRGAALISTEREREQVATFNLMAGKRAKAATAYAAALRYFVVGRLLLGENGWEQCYQLTFELELNRGECEYLTGELAAAEERLSQLSTRARTIVHAAAGACVRINLYTTLDRSNRAVEVGLEYLRRVDARWPQHATAEDVQHEYDWLRQRLGSGSIEWLLDLPLMTDPDRRATMDVLTVLTSPALFTDLNLFRLVVGRMASLSLEYGNSDGSSLAYAWLGGVLGTHFGDYQAGFRFGQLGLDLVEKRCLDRFRARVYLVFAVHVAHWTQPLATSRAFLRRAFEAAQEAGDLSYAAYSCIDLTANLFASGAPLDQVEREAEIGIKFAQDVGFGLADNNLTVQLRLVRMLRGLTLDFGSFNDATFDESRFVQRFENNRELSICASWYWIRKLQAGIYVNDSVAAIAATTKVAPLLWTTPTQIEQSEYQFYGALALAARCDEAPAEERSQHLAALADHSRQIAVWAENCPENFENRVALVGAEIARIEGRELDAERLYELAIASARANGFIHNEALAYELAARFYAARGFKQIADLYLRNARYGYLRWGAVGKVRQLDETYPDLRQEASLPGPTSTIGTPVEHLDLATVIKVSQAVSGEIVLENLIDTLMHTAMEQAGAERALLIMPRGQEPRIEAEATTSGNTVTVRLVDEAVTEGVLPESVLHYVLHTRESVILDDAAAQSPYGVDSYIRQRQARSILCLPLLNQAKLIGVLYLENNLTPRVFAPARISVLKLLASQAAIALENAHLYRDVTEREKQQAATSEMLRLISNSPIQSVLDAVAENAARLCDASNAQIFRLEDNLLRLAASYGEIPVVIHAYQGVPVNRDTVTGRAAWDRRTIHVHDLAAEESEYPVGSSNAKREGHRTTLGTPLLREGTPVGIILVRRMEVRPFSDQQVALLETFADQAVIAIENARLFKAEQQRTLALAYANRDLAERETKIRRLVDSNIIGIFIWDFDGRILEANDEFLRMVSYDREDLVSGRIRWADLTPPDWRDRNNARIEQQKSSGRFEPFEKEYTRKDGSRVPVLIGGATFEEGGNQGVAFVLDLTERKRGEEALRESEARFRTMADTAPVLIWTTDADKFWTYVSQTWLDLTGRSFEEELGNGWADDIHPSDRDARLEAYAHCFDQRSPFTLEYRVRRHDGEYRWLLDKGTPRFAPDGTFLGYIGSATDITERKRTEERLRVQHTVAQILAEAATIEEATPRILRAMGECLGWDVGALWRVDREAEALRCVELWHKASIEVTEFERVSRELTFAPGLGLPGRVWSSLEPEYVPDVVLDENFPRGPIAEREGLHAAFGFPILLGGEVLGVIECFSREIRQPDQELLNMLATIGSQIGQFIERKRAEDALRESEAKFRDYAATASDWLWEIGPDYKFTLLTENAFRSNSADRIGTFCWDQALDLETESEKWRLVRATLESRKPFRDLVYCSVDGSGSPMYVRASGKPVFDANGEFRGYRGTGSDVTALRTVEAEARENERRYRGALLELAHANRVATMGQLTASITHEVNQPITAAVTYALAARRWLSAEPPNFHEVDDALSLIVKEGNRAGDVVGRIRALIKKAPARKDAVEINDAILEVIALTRTEAANNSVSVRTQLAEGLPCVQGDRVQLQQVLLNLIINAIEAMRDVGEEERELLISTRNEPDGVSVEVRDSGPGFTPAVLDRVFEAFYTTKPGGLGLGLSICRSIIEAHNGRLWASPNVPRGAIFRFIAPAHPAATS